MDQLLTGNFGSVMVTKSIFSLAFIFSSPVLLAQNSNPTVDASFGTSGVVTTTFNTSGHGFGQRLVLQNDGTFFVIGSAGSTSTSHMAAVRYNTSGKPDSGFGVNGKSIIS